MNSTQLSAAIQWWNRDGSFNLDLLEKVLLAKAIKEAKDKWVFNVSHKITPPYLQLIGRRQRIKEVING